MGGVAAMTKQILKEWPTPIWVVVRNGEPIDYAFSRALAFKKAAQYRLSQPAVFWSVARGHGAVALKIIR
jgi:hypothetical protein